MGRNAADADWLQPSSYGAYRGFQHGTAAFPCWVMKWGLRFGDACREPRAGCPQPGSGATPGVRHLCGDGMGHRSTCLSWLHGARGGEGNGRAVVWHPPASLGQGLMAQDWAETGSGCSIDLLQRACAPSLLPTCSQSFLSYAGLRGRSAAGLTPIKRGVREEHGVLP